MISSSISWTISVDWETSSCHEWEPTHTWNLKTGTIQHLVLRYIKSLNQLQYLYPRGSYRQCSGLTPEGRVGGGGSYQPKFVYYINMRWRIAFFWRSLLKRPVEFSNILDKYHRTMPLELYPYGISVSKCKLPQSYHHSRDIPSDRCKCISRDLYHTQWRKTVSRLCRLRFLVTVLALSIVQPWRQTGREKFPLWWKMSYST